MANKKYNLYELKQYKECWVDIPIEVIPENKQDIFCKRKQAVDMYIDGVSVSEIESKTGINVSHIPNYIDRCLMTSDTGEMYGYHALIPRFRINKNSNGGLFQSLLSEYPTLVEFIRGNYFGEKKYTLEHNMNLKTLHQKFLKECLRLGVQQHEYPFNTDNRGYVSLCKYIKELKSENIALQSNRESKNHKQQLLSTGFGQRYTRNAIAPFSQVQVDGHIIDLVYNVEILNIDGTISRTIATRAWLFVVIDVATRCILGYTVSQEFNYNQYDVMNAIKDAIVPKQKMKFTIKGLEYPDNGGFYSLAYPELQYALFDTLMLDNAKSHLASHTTNKIVDELKVAINFGSVATPETRGIVERFFGGLETRGFHKLPMTTGSNTRDLKRKEPEKASIKYNVTFDEICELVETMIAEYNNTPHNGIDNLTPLECMYKKVFEAGMMPTLADDTMKNVISKLDYRTDTRKVRGGKNGKRAYITFMGSEYRSNQLSLTGNYIGTEIKIIYNPRDISTLEAYTSDGTYIGTLHAKGEFGTKSHSIKTRKNAMRLARERGREKLEFDTPITAYEKYLNDSGSSNRRNATKADIIRREQGKANYSETIENNKSNQITYIKEKCDIDYESIKNLDTYEQYEILFGKKAK